MGELNREQIIKALECCVSSDTVDACRSGCPLFEKGDDCECIFEPTALHKYALSLIKELTEENERLRQYEITYETPSGKQTMPNLLSLDGDAAELYKRIEDNVKFDTVRKMQERLMDTKTKICGEYYIYAENVNVIAKEMLEGEK